MRMKKKEYVYFISYAHANGFGNCSTIVNFEIKNMEDLNAISRKIEEDNQFEKVIILFYRNFGK